MTNCASIGPNTTGERHGITGSVSRIGRRQMVKAKPSNVVGKIIEWENGEMSEPETQELFEELVQTGLIYQLQGAYGREAHRRGLI